MIDWSAQKPECRRAGGKAGNGRHAQFAATD